MPALTTVAADDACAMSYFLERKHTSLISGTKITVVRHKVSDIND